MKFNLLIVNGWASDATVFKPFTDLFKDYIQSCIILDWHEDSIISDEKINNAIKKLQSPSPSNCPTLLLGWSCGCFPIIKYLSGEAISSSIIGGVLIGASPRFTSDFDSGYSIGWHPKVLNQMITNLYAQADLVISTFAKKTMSHDDQSKKEKTALYQEVFKRTHVESLGNELKALGHIDLRGHLLKISHPICLITGANDLICPISGAQFINNGLDKSQLHIIKKTGHAPHFFEPRACVKTIKHFIKENFEEITSND